MTKATQPVPLVPEYAPAQAVSTSEEVQARQTFLRLLCRPLVTAHIDTQLYRDALRYAKQIDGYCKRLDYRRAHLGGAIRLVRNPILGTVIAPPRPIDLPPNRVLTLTALLAAACEEVEGGVTLVKLSELVAELSSSADRQLTPYDPDLLAERRSLVKAAAILEFWGVLRKRTTLVSDVQEWTETRHGIGAGYDVDREALLLFVTPDTIALAAHQQAQFAHLHRPDHVDGDEPATRSPMIGPSPEEDSPDAIWESQRQASRVVRHLRTLVETPALLYADLPPDEAELARGQRGLRAGEAIGLIGGSIEARAEGLVWISREDECPATVVWPTARTESWAALMVADKAGRDGHHDDDGFVHLASSEVEDILEDLTEWKGHLFRVDLRNDPTQLRIAVEDTLRWLDLLRTDADGSWHLSPVTGRYRDPELVEPMPGPEQADLSPDPTSDSIYFTSGQADRADCATQTAFDLPEDTRDQ
ncbi:DUF2398 family protein [Paenarthrobacter sp. NPDC057981]|uniref:DUF2398 family protein n=1 Tax=Paenarthrobacter sp. NPDC057981 TaxID=3346297 RepID=UPI0036D905F2